MKILYYDCFSGISGDMNLGALLDLGIDKSYLINELKKIKLDEYELEIKKELKQGIEGTKVNVKVKEKHHHHHSHEHGHTHSHSHHRHYSDIKKMIEESELSQTVKLRSLKMFEKIGLAEAKIHGKTLEEIHFHEVGAVDSIVDIVGAAILLEKLDVDRIYSSSVQVGGGFVECAHGTFPVPAPATTEILTGIPIKKGAVEHETTTPTGAAILATNVNIFDDKVQLKIEKTAYGIGHKDFGIPNILRVHLAEIEPHTVYGTSIITECNIDDMNPEFYEFVMEKLFESGASDVYFTPIHMKKSRPAIKLSVLHPDELSHTVERLLFEHTSTIGLRRITVEKAFLKREIRKVVTKYGEVTIKYTFIGDSERKWKPEYRECVKIANENNISLQDVYNEINKHI